MPEDRADPPPDGPPSAQGPPPGYEQQPGRNQQPGPYPGAAAPTYWGQPAFGLSPQEERTWGMFAHLGALIAGLVVGLSFLGPLIVLLTQGSKSAFVRRHAVESLNFQITVIIAAIVGSVLSVLAIVVTVGVALLIIIPAAVAAVIAVLVFTVIGAIKANQGEDYRYPVNVRLVK